MPAHFIPKLVREARGTQTQGEFARRLGVNQSMISRYESGKSSPPRHILDQCMQMVHTPLEHSPSAEELASMMMDKLAGPDHAGIRQAIYGLIQHLPSPSAQSR